MCSFTQRINQKDENRPYVKKPLNAFMIFRKEQRPIVMAEQKIRDSATVNAIVGQKVSVCDILDIFLKSGFLQDWLHHDSIVLIPYLQKKSEIYVRFSSIINIITGIRCTFGFF